MKICFSTLGCPEWKLTEIASTAADLKYDGIEIRGIGKDVFAPDSPFFSEDKIEASASALKSAGVDVLCLDTTCVLSSPSLWSEEAILKTCKLAAALSCPYVRVLGDAQPEPSDVDDTVVIAALKKACEIASSFGVTVIIETNGVYSFSERLVGVIKAVNADNLGVLWDIQHPYRVAGEKIEDTFNAIKDYLCHVHIKDSVLKDGKTVYKMTGYGDMPIKTALDILKDANFEGAVSLEWLKRWVSELEDAGIVFAHFIKTVKRFLA